MWRDHTWRIGYLGGSRWRVQSHLVRSWLAPRGKPVPLGTDAHASSHGDLARILSWRMNGGKPGHRLGDDVVPGDPGALPRHFGEARLSAPGMTSVFHLAFREDLKGRTPDASGPPIDVYREVHNGKEVRSSGPFMHKLGQWFWRHSERMWGVGVERPPDRFGKEFSWAAFAASRNPTELARKLEIALMERLRNAEDPFEAFLRATRELEAEGHECRHTDERVGRFFSWESAHLRLAGRFNPNRDDDPDEPSDERSLKGWFSAEVVWTQPGR